MHACREMLDLAGGPWDYGSFLQTQLDDYVKMTKEFMEEEGFPAEPQ